MSDMTSSAITGDAAWRAYRDAGGPIVPDAAIDGFARGCAAIIEATVTAERARLLAALSPAVRETVVETWAALDVAAEQERAIQHLADLLERELGR